MKTKLITLVAAVALLIGGAAIPANAASPVPGPIHVTHPGDEKVHAADVTPFWGKPFTYVKYHTCQIGSIGTIELGGFNRQREDLAVYPVQIDLYLQNRVNGIYPQALRYRDDDGIITSVKLGPGSIYGVHEVGVGQKHNNDYAYDLWLGESLQTTSPQGTGDAWNPSGAGAFTFFSRTYNSGIRWTLAYKVDPSSNVTYTCTLDMHP